MEGTLRNISERGLILKIPKSCAHVSRCNKVTLKIPHIFCVSKKKLSKKVLLVQAVTKIMKVFTLTLKLCFLKILEILMKSVSSTVTANSWSTGSFPVT